MFIQANHGIRIGTCVVFALEFLAKFKCEKDNLPLPHDIVVRRQATTYTYAELLLIGTVRTKCFIQENVFQMSTKCLQNVCCSVHASIFAVIDRAIWICYRRPL